MCSKCSLNEPSLSLPSFPMVTSHQCPLPGNTPSRAIKDFPPQSFGGHRRLLRESEENMVFAQPALSILHTCSRWYELLCHRTLQFWVRAPDIQRILEKSDQQTCARHPGRREALPGLQIHAPRCTNCDSAQCSPPRECAIGVTHQALHVGWGGGGEAAIAYNQKPSWRCGPLSGVLRGAKEFTNPMRKGRTFVGSKCIIHKNLNSK